MSAPHPVAVSAKRGRSFPASRGRDLWTERQALFAFRTAAPCPCLREPSLISLRVVLTCAPVSSRRRARKASASAMHHCRAWPALLAARAIPPINGVPSRSPDARSTPRSVASGSFGMRDDSWASASAGRSTFRNGPSPSSRPSFPLHCSVGDAVDCAAHRLHSLVTASRVCGSATSLAHTIVPTTVRRPPRTSPQPAKVVCAPDRSPRESDDHIGFMTL